MIIYLLRVRKVEESLRSDGLEMVMIADALLYGEP
jgi:hypothetical protein